MTVDECHSTLAGIRKRQGTRCPLVRVDYAGKVIQGRVARADSDPEHRSEPSSPYGVIVLENLGLSRFPETILQIASIPAGGLQELSLA
jgi:hypothetical protein